MLSAEHFSHLCLIIVALKIAAVEVGQYRFADINTISIFLTQNISDIDILNCSSFWPAHSFHYRKQSSQ